MNIEFFGNDAIVQLPDVAFTFQTTDNPRELEKLRGINQDLDWDKNHHNFYGEYIVYPFGSHNDLPRYIKTVVQNNYIAPGLLNRKVELLWGLGPRLFIEKIENNKIVRDWEQQDAKVQQWLESFDYEDYLLKCAIDYHHLQSCFSRFEQTKGIRVSSPFIKEVHHVSPDYARLARHRSTNTTNPSHVIVTDWNFNTANDLLEAKVYPIANSKNINEFQNSIYFSSKYTFCTDYYTVPEIYGSLEWLLRSTAVPLIFKAMTENAINAKYHIISPQAFWDEKTQEIKDNCSKKGIAYHSSMLKDYQTDFLKQIGKFLSGIENTGKYIHTIEKLEVDGTNLLKHGWEIKLLDSKIKDFVEAQIQISTRADRAVSSGISLHSALGNMSETGKVDSGSEQLYALLSYLNTGVDIPEMIITKSINLAIKSNFPNTKFRLGFYHNTPEKQQDISPKDRTINNTAN